MPRPNYDVDKVSIPSPSTLDGTWTGVSFAPDGWVRCRYAFSHDPSVPGGIYYANAFCDLDDDGINWRAGAGRTGSEPQGLWPGCAPFNGCPPMTFGTMDSGECCV